MRVQVMWASRDANVMNHDQGMARRAIFVSQPVARITTNPEPCIAMLLEKLQKSDWSGLWETGVSTCICSIFIYVLTFITYVYRVQLTHIYVIVAQIQG